MVEVKAVLKENADQVVVNVLMANDALMECALVLVLLITTVRLVKFVLEVFVSLAAVEMRIVVVLKSVLEVVVLAFQALNSFQELVVWT